METIQILALQRPMWTKGLAQIDEGYIVLEGERAEEYGLFDTPQQHTQLLMDLEGLCRLGLTKDGGIVDVHYVLDFARRPGTVPRTWKTAVGNL